MVTIRPKGLPVGCTQHVKKEGAVPCFVVHPATHELAEMLVVDSTALSDENYSGIYDEKGDYVPQYCDNPEDIPQGAMQANPDSGPASPGGTGGPDKPAEPSSSDPAKPSE